MFSLLKYSVKINVNLDNGVYVFDNESATGKSRLYSLVKKYSAYGEPVAGYTFEDFCRGLDITAVLNPKKFALVVLDRLDMYSNRSILSLIEKSAHDCIILVDCKNDFQVNIDYDWCYINMTANAIEVS
ncbi:MAG: hypothetical protein HFG50_11485 [Lachnospiraceae bacterium]|nr:hypothetical protein [Lachnospiraceae bacterium]